MKRLLLPFLLAFFGFSGILKAQPTLTAANTNVQVGEQFISKAFFPNAGHFNIGLSAGPNLTWNMSSLASPFSNLIDVLFQPQLPIGFNPYPAANVVIRCDDEYEYLKTNTDSVMMVGYYNHFTEETIDYSNPVKKLSYPFTFNSFFVDNFVGIGDGMGPPINLGGYITVTGDGYGGLILPVGTINNVLRVKTMKVTITNSFIDTTTTLDWYQPGIHVPVLKISESKFSSLNYNAITYKGYFIDPFALSTTKGNANQFNLQTFPNPATSETTIQYELKNPGAVRLVLTDVLGRETEICGQKTQAAGHYIEKLDLSHYSKGIYFIRLETGRKVALKQLVVR